MCPKFSTLIVYNMPERRPINLHLPQVLVMLEICDIVAQTGERCKINSEGASQSTVGNVLEKLMLD